MGSQYILFENVNYLHISMQINNFSLLGDMNGRVGNVTDGCVIGNWGYKIYNLKLLYD